MKNKKYLTYDDIKSELDRYSNILKAMYEKLFRRHKENLRPAQVEGLWQHHTNKFGLLEHSLEVSDIAFNTLGIKDINLYRLFKVIGLAHDYGKLFGKDQHDHAKWSLEYFEKEFIPEFEKEYKDKDEFKNFLNSDIYQIIKLGIRWHHINFEEKLKPFDKDAFIQRGGELFETKYFPWVLLLLAADFASIAKDWIIDNSSKKDEK